MKPALTTRSGEKTATASARAASHEARSGKSTGATTAVGIRAARAITRPPAVAVSLTTATTRAPYDGSTWAASNAARLVPVPEMRTTTRRPAETGTGAPVGVVTVVSARPGSEITHETLSSVRDNGGGVAVIRMAVPGRRDRGCLLDTSPSSRD